MKWCLVILAFLSCPACMPAQNLPGYDDSTPDQSQAGKDFRRAQALEKSGRTEDALEFATAATELAPRDAQYLTMRQLLREELAGKYLQHGNLMAEVGNSAGARAQFEAALALDPENSYLQQRLGDVSPARPPEDKHILQMMASVDQFAVAPNPGQQDFHIHADTRGLYEQLGRAFGVSVQFDSTLLAKQVNFDVGKVDFFTAMMLAGKLTKTFWAPISTHGIIVAGDSLEMRQQYERMGLRIFYVNTGSTTEITDLANMLRSIFELKFLTVQPANHTIAIRATRAQLDAIGSLMENLVENRPEILLEVQAYEINTDQARKVGLNTPTDFQIFSIAAEIYRILGPAAKGVLDQLSRTGTIDPATIPAAALGKLQGSPLLAPFVFFGKGFGLTGISAQPINVQLSRNSSVSTNLEHVQLRASDGEAATFHVGSRVPIVASNFTSVGLDAAGQPAVGPTTPSFQYQDVGVTLKATPHYHRDGEVTLNMELTINTLGAVQPDGLPLIINREYKGAIRIRNGEPAVVTGDITDQDTRTTQGYPVIGQLSFLNEITNANTKDHQHEEILVVVTPHVVGAPFHEAGSDMVWLH